jgi:uncharacterized protein YlbG (UPF0298 family)
MAHGLGFTEASLNTETYGGTIVLRAPGDAVEFLIPMGFSNYFSPTSYNFNYHIDVRDRADVSTVEAEQLHHIDISNEHFLSTTLMNLRERQAKTDLLGDLTSIQKLQRAGLPAYYVSKVWGYAQLYYWDELENKIRRLAKKSLVDDLESSKKLTIRRSAELLPILTSRLEQLSKTLEMKIDCEAEQCKEESRCTANVSGSD